MINRAGLKQIVLCNAGTLLTTPSYPLAIGLRGPASMEITPFKEVKDYRDRNLRNMLNFKIEAESLHTTMQYLRKAIDWAKNNCDAQIITNENEVYQFSSNINLGLDFEYLLTQDKISLKLILEGAFPYNDAKVIINSASLNTQISFIGITGEGANFLYYRSPHLITLEAPKTDSLFSSLRDLSEINLSIKTKNKKNIYNISIVDYVTFELKISSRESSISKIVEHLAKDISPSILIKKMNWTTNYYDAFDFAANVLTIRNEFKNSDDDRLLTVIFSGDVPINDIEFLFGSGNGGDATDTEGKLGGTMKVGY